VADCSGIEHTTEIAAADSAYFFFREALLHHLRHHREIETDFLVRPSLVGPLTNARSSTARTRATAFTT
jgi:hypothetical protein